ncbi:MAG: serine--tRNA ligase [Candidatus Latescibacterota bacterium]|nr:MAG: serine--tRNA ligase [Candidatus Latescibacterota bacterium]
MLDRRLIRDDPDKVVKGIESKNVDTEIGTVIALDKELLAIQKQSEELKHERNVKSAEVAAKKRAGEDADELHMYLKNLSQRIKDIEAKSKEASARLDELLLTLPNLPHASVPIGKDESDNVVRRTWGEVTEPYFDVLPHWEIGEKLRVLDLEAGRRVTGRGYIVLRGDGALLSRALVNFMLDLHRDQGYEEVLVPYVVNRGSMVGTGQLPKMAEDMYHCEIDDLFLIPTAEVPVTNIERDSFTPADELPVKYTAYSPCFRREAGSHGADTRGLLRVHQFDKVEMVKVVYPDDSYDELESLLDDACVVLEALELPYRVLELCTGDLSFAAAKCYDLEVWSPGVEKWLEVSSCSNFEDFQARRANIKIKKAKGERHRFVHTLNGSGLALARTIAAILEHHQTPTGRVRIPAKLVPYMQGKEYLG